MPLVEVDQEQLQALQKAAEEAKTAVPSKALLDKIGGNPKTRAQFLKLWKEVQPDVVIPEIDAATPHLEALEGIRKEFHEFKKSLEDEKEETSKKRTLEEIDNQIKRGRKKLKDQGWLDEGIASVEKLMQDRGISDYDAAAALWEKENPKEEPIIPSNFGESQWNLLSDNQEDEGIKAAVALPKGPAQDRALKRWQNKELQSFFNEIRGAGRARV
jgi:hypothetical protein